MTIAGAAAMLLWYDIVPDQVAEHDEWHTREHFPERVGIPGFLRAQRWVAQGATSPRYFVSYEVRDLSVLTSPAYQARLEHPTDWTRRMMPHFRGMVRGFCTLCTHAGTALGSEVLSLRFSPSTGRREALARWLREDALPGIAGSRGVSSAIVYTAAVRPPMTVEQSLRGRDAEVDSVLLVSSYDPAALDGLSTGALAPHALTAHGAGAEVLCGRYRLACRADAEALVAP